MLKNSQQDLGLTKSVAGAFINTLDISTQDMPGNFGIRVLETMPTNLSEIWRERLSVPLDYACLPGQFKVPDLLKAAVATDCLTDDDSDAADFQIKVSHRSLRCH